MSLVYKLSVMVGTDVNGSDIKVPSRKNEKIVILSRVTLPIVSPVGPSLFVESRVNVTGSDRFFRTQLSRQHR